SIGTTHGDDVAFTTAPDSPVVATGTPIATSGTDATLVGAVNPNGRATEVQFEWGATNLYGNTTSIQGIPAGNNIVDVFAPISGLVPGGTYHYRIVASNPGGNAAGEDVSFVATNGGGGGGGPTAKPARRARGSAGL